VSDRQTTDQSVRRASLGDDLSSFEIEDDRFDALGTGIDANEETHERARIPPHAVSAGEPIPILKLDSAEPLPTEFEPLGNADLVGANRFT
jgi:hypothetical protein